MLYKGEKVIVHCLLCKNYHNHPCKCVHCENYNNFKFSEDGKKLYEEIFEQGYNKCKETKYKES